MAQVTLGNHAAVVVSLTEQDAVRRFYRDVLGCALTRSADDKDRLRPRRGLLSRGCLRRRGCHTRERGFPQGNIPGTAHQQCRGGATADHRLRRQGDPDRRPAPVFPSPRRASLPARRHGRGHVQIRGHHAPPQTTGRSVQLARHPSSKLAVTAPRVAIVRTCRRQGRASRASRTFTVRVTLALGSRVLGEPRTESASKAVTDSNLCLGAPAQRPA